MGVSQGFCSRSPDYRIIDAAQAHVGPHVAHLTAKERAEIEAVTGIPPRRFVRRLLQQSSYARAAVICNVPVALWGLTGTLLSPSGHIWLSVTQEARARPFAFMAVARSEAATLLATKAELRSMVRIDDARALRFLRHLGFEIGEISLAECGRMFRAAVLRHEVL